MSGALRALVYFGSIVLALLLQFFPLPGWLAFARPLWLPMVLVFWTLMDPRLPNLTAALLFGLCYDTLVDSALGSHAIAIMPLIYFAGRLRQPLALSPWWQVSLALAPLWALYAAIMTGLDSLTHHYADPWLRWLPVATSVVIWPLFSALMERLDTQQVPTVE